MVAMGPSEIFLIRVGLGQPSLVWVFIWKISTKNHKFFNFLPLGQKKIFSGWVKKFPGQRQVGLVFIADQKYGRLGSGPISTKWY